VRRNLVCDEGFTAFGEVRHINNGAHVGGLNLSGATLEDPNGYALTADGLTVAQSMVRRLQEYPKSPALLAAVAAGIPAFGQELGQAAEGVLGPVQWWPTPQEPEIGPSGSEFVTRYRERTGRAPSYPAAQAAAASYLAHAAHRVGMATEDVVNWASSTLLGDFALDSAWRQIGHRVTTVRWLGGHIVPLPAR
jgi:ABC-type branched-subunit amino acid transport system substrate-binding protein